MLQLTAHPTLSIVPRRGATFDLLLLWQSTQQSPRRPLNLSLVLDRSGSMAGQPLRQAIIAATRVVAALTAQDTLSVVAYDDEVATVVPPVAVTDPAAITAQIRRIAAGGLTNLSGGWLRGCEHVAARHQPTALSRVLLLTDGQANVGVTDPAMLWRSATAQAERGISTTTLGFGSHFNEDMLLGLARAGRGNYYFIQSPDDAADVFAIELESLRTLAAQNVSVRLLPRPGVTLAPLGTTPQTPLPDGGLALELGDVYEGEGRPLLASVTLAAGSAAATQVIADIHYSYQMVHDGVVTQQTGQGEVVIRLGTDDEAMLAAPNSDIVARASLVRIAQAKDEAVRLADRGEGEEAVRLLRAAASLLESQGLGETFTIAEELEQLRYFADLIAQRGYGAASRKELRDQAYQGQARTRGDLHLRGSASGSVAGLPRVAEVGDGVEIECVREGGRLRLRVISPGYDPTLNVQFPRAIRFEGAHYLVDGVTVAGDGTFYRTTGTIRLLVRPGEEQRYQTGGRQNQPLRPVRPTLTLADLEETDSVGGGVLVQCIREGSKLRARVVSDGYDPAMNMRFPRAIRQENVLYVVDAVTLAGDGKSYVAQGTIKRMIQL